MGHSLNVACRACLVVHGTESTCQGWAHKLYPWSSQVLQAQRGPSAAAGEAPREGPCAAVKSSPACRSCSKSPLTAGKTQRSQTRGEEGVIGRANGKGYWKHRLHFFTSAANTRKRKQLRLRQIRQKSTVQK